MKSPHFTGKYVLLTFRRTLILVIPHHQQFSQAGHLGDFRDDPEKTLDAIVGQHHCREARCPWRDEWQEEGAVYAGPLLQETRDRKKANCLGCKPNTLFVFHFLERLPWTAFQEFTVKPRLWGFPWFSRVQRWGHLQQFKKWWFILWGRIIQL